MDIYDIFTDKVRTHIKEKNLIAPGDRIIIGLSGGADSVCLFRMLAELRDEYSLSLYAVHVNHGIRHEDADADELFAKELAGEYNIPYRSYHYSVKQIAKDASLSVEEAGRQVRYEVFEKERQLCGADKIAVAHHMNDQAETILFRMCRGTGIKGLLGMAPSGGYIIRPLMCLRRDEIIQYLKEAGQDYREDITNSCMDYDRNRIRLGVVPELEKINKKAIEHIDALSRSLRDIYGWLEAEADRLYKEYVKESEDSVSICCADLFSMQKAAAEEVVKRMIYANTQSLKDITMQHIDSVIKIASMETGKRIDLPYGLSAEKQYGIIMIKKDRVRDEAGESYEYVFAKEDVLKEPLALRIDNVYLPDEGIFYERIDISVSVKEYTHGIMDIPKNSCTKWFDYDRIKSMLGLRRPRKNDYFVLRGGGTKKLARYMIDGKIPRDCRESLLVAAEGSHILTVFGGRTGEDYYAGEGTKTVLEICIVNLEQEVED